MKILRNIILDIIIVFLTLVVICIISGFVQLNVLNKDYFDIFGYTIFNVETGSMNPIIQIGDIIIVKLTDNIQEDDIITFKENNKFITHRVININENEIITKGDNNNTQDKPIRRTDVLGKVVYMVNNVNIWKKVFSDIRVIIPVAISIILLFILTAYREKSGRKEWLIKQN